MIDINYLDDEVLDAIANSLGMGIDWQADDADKKVKQLQEHIANMDPVKLVSLYLQWHGIIGPSWARNIIGAIESIKSASQDGDEYKIF